MTVLAGDIIELEPQTVLQGDAPVFSINLEGVTTVLNDATLLMFVFKGSVDKTSTFTTGSVSRTNGPPAIITTKTFQSLVGGDSLVVTVYGTMDGIVQGRQFKLYVRSNSGKK